MNFPANRLVRYGTSTGRRTQNETSDRSWPGGVLVVFFAFMLLFSCNKPAPQTLFSEIAASESGIDFQNRLPEQSDEGMDIVRYLYYYNGGGVAAGDLNNDSLPDLYFTANLGPNSLYLNKGGFRFENATAKSGTGGTGSWKTGVTFADVNADGWLDIYVCQVGNYKSFKGKNQLFINNRNGTFTDRAAEFGLDLSAFCTQAAFFDYDLDGDLDCFILCHSVHSPESYKDTAISRRYDPLASDRLFRNDGGTFTDITPVSGLHDGKSGYGLGLVVGDVNGDGFPDIYVANDFHENDFLYYNVRGKYFREGIVASTGHTSNFSMGCDMADVNNDGFPDIVTLDMKPEDEPTLKASQPPDQYQVYEYKHSYGYHWQFPRNCLQLNRGGTGFSEIGQLSGIATTDWSWSPLLADFDLDGHKDLFVSNGIPHRPNNNDYLKYISSNEVQRNATDQDLIAQMPSGAATNYCFRNSGDLRFEDVSQNWGLAHKGFSNGAIYADLDNDGDLDLVTNNLNEPASVFRNDMRAGHFLKLRFSGTPGNPFGIGARIQVFSGNTMQYAENQPVRGFQSAVEPGVLCIGLGENTQVDSLVVTWPDGARETRYGIATNTTLLLSASQAVPHSPGEFKAPSESAPQQRNDLSDIAREKLMPWSLATQGPKLSALPPALKNALPALITDTSCIRLADFDGDGDLDLFAGARWLPGKYGLTPKSYLLRNDGSNRYSDATNLLPGGYEVGMVTDALWTDTDGDGRPDLVVCGEWAAVTVYRNTGSGFEKTELPQSAGMWNCIKAADYDNDGDMDLIAGNLGWNSNLEATPAEPLGLWVKDFDGNGSTDPVLTYYRQGKNYVFADKDLLVNQMPFLKKRYVEYGKYAESTFEDVFPEALRRGAISRKAELLASCFLENKGNGQWAVHPMPVEAQFSPVFAILPYDFNGDGHLDVLLGGNFYEVQPAIGRFDASYGTLLLGDGKGGFRPTSLSGTGIWLPGPVRDLAISDGPNGQKRLLVARNGLELQIIDLSLPIRSHVQ